MQIKYFQTAWNDLKNSPGWFGKMCLLALVNFIPIFGQIVTYGYLYGWAREIAWGAHQPLKASIFSNEDGKFWRRGWFLFVISFVFSLVPSVIIGIGSSMQGVGFKASFYGVQLVPTTVDAGMAGVGALLYLVGLVLTVFISIFMWVAFMRSAIYDNLSSGFQLGKIWQMVRHDSNGILRILGMDLLAGLVISIVAGFVATIIALVFVAAGAGAYASLDSSAAMIASMGVIAVVLLLVFVYAAIVAGMIVEALVARAVGYWTMQFDVPRWRGQDDPMPFEQAPPANPQYPTY